MKSKGSFGFTIIELLVVIVIASLIFSIILVIINNAKASARDVRRKADLDAIRKALIMYRNNEGNWIETIATVKADCATVPPNQGAGWGGDGYGYFNVIDGGNYPNSMGICLRDKKYTDSEIIDPTGNKGGCTPANNNYCYMKYTCTLGGAKITTLFAKLETGINGASDPIVSGTCCNSCDTGYGMNYYINVQ